jgi:membrane protein DedA with SNARE-associated domain
MDNLTFFQTIYHIIIQNPALSYWIVFISGVLEATIFIGLFIPTGILIVVYGFVAYNGYITGSNVIAVAILGAIVGDIVNYAFGRYHLKKYQVQNIQKVEKIFKKKNYLDHGKVFFEKHGGKSVFLGRFIGMVRPFISFISGTAKMPFKKFMYFNIFGAIVWVIFYFSVGYLFASSAARLSEMLGAIGDISFFFAFLIILFILLRTIFNQKIQPKVIERSEEILEKIEKKDI